MRCPRCKQEVNLVEMIMDNDLQTLFSVLPQFGTHSRLAWEYCELFDVVPVGKKMKKLARLLAEVGALFGQGKFRFQQREYAISVPGIVEGLKTVCNKGFERPLENHNYLKKVLIGIADKERTEARDAEDRALRAREEAGNRRTGEPENRRAGDNDHDSRPISAAEFKKRRGVESLAAGIGRAMDG